MTRHERRFNWPIFLLVAFWLMVYAVARPQNLPTTSVSTNVEGLAAILQTHIDEHAPDTVITFTRTGARRSAFVNVGAGSFHMRVDSLVPSDAVLFQFRQVGAQDTALITDAWLFAGSKRAFQYARLNKQLNVWCTGITKTQAKLRLFITYYPLMPDSVAIVKRK